MAQRRLHVDDIHESDVVGAYDTRSHPILVNPLGRWTELKCERITGVHELPAMLSHARV